MTYKNSRSILTFMALVLIAVLAACATDSRPDQLIETENLSAGIVVYGDSGYHLDYMKEDDYLEKFTEEEFRQDEKDSWLEDKRPPDEFEVRPHAVSPATGGVVMASGMQAISTAMKNFCRVDAVCDFGLMLGDNIYPSGATLGTDGFDDAKRFKDVLQDPFGNVGNNDAGYLTYATLGNHDWETSRDGGFAQIDYLEQAVEKGTINAEWARNDEDLAKLRGHPRFEALLERLPNQQ